MIVVAREDRVATVREDRVDARVVPEDVPEALDAILVYLPPATTLGVLPGIARKGAETVYFNPGSESADVVRTATDLGIEPVLACSIIAIGESPSSFQP